MSLQQNMHARKILWLALIACVSAARLAAAASDATLVRLFLVDGTSLVSYGEYARADDRVIFSTPVGGTADEPRLHVVTVPAGLVDWPRTDRYAASARYQRYAATHGEEDYAHLTGEIARVLNAIATTTDRRQALAIAEQARRVVAEWPRAHYGYRQAEVRDITAILDEAITSLRAATGPAEFELSLVATPPPPDLEPLLGMPTARYQLDTIFRIVEMTTNASERVALLQSALALIREHGAAESWADAAAIRRRTENSIRAEIEVDARYARLSRRLIDSARGAVARARIAVVERLIAELPNQDARLGRQRPDVVVALRTALQAELDAARRMRLLIDQWAMRRDLYREYQRAVGIQVMQLVKSQPQLEAIRRLDGPSPDGLAALRGRLSGGAARLERVRAPDALQAIHGLMVGAWRFAEAATHARYNAIAAGSVATAWEASSAAAGALMLLSRAQAEIRQLLEPPRVQ